MLDASRGSRNMEGIEGSIDVEGIEGSISGSSSIEGIESCMGSKGSSSIKGSMAVRAQWARGVQRALKGIVDSRNSRGIIVYYILDTMHDIWAI